LRLPEGGVSWAPRRKHNRLPRCLKEQSSTPG
jgi:hypothetical protein